MYHVGCLNSGTPRAGRACRADRHAMPPPSWALLELNLIKQQEEAVEAFYNQYFDERGYLMCVPRWGGDDGPDDAAENFANWAGTLRDRRFGAGI